MFKLLRVSTLHLSLVCFLFRGAVQSLSSHQLSHYPSWVSEGRPRTSSALRILLFPSMHVTPRPAYLLMHAGILILHKGMQVQRVPTLSEHQCLQVPILQWPRDYNDHLLNPAVCIHQFLPCGLHSNFTPQHALLSAPVGLTMFGYTIACCKVGHLSAAAKDSLRKQRAYTRRLKIWRPRTDLNIERLPSPRNDFLLCLLCPSVWHQKTTFTSCHTFQRP